MGIVSQKQSLHSGGKSPFSWGMAITMMACHWASGTSTIMVGNLHWHCASVRGGNDLSRRWQRNDSILRGGVVLSNCRVLLSSRQTASLTLSLHSDEHGALLQGDTLWWVDPTITDYVNAQRPVVRYTSSQVTIPKIPINMPQIPEQIWAIKCVWPKQGDKIMEKGGSHNKKKYKDICFHNPVLKASWGEVYWLLQSGDCLLCCCPLWRVVPKTKGTLSPSPLKRKEKEKRQQESTHTSALECIVFYSLLKMNTKKSHFQIKI